MIVRLENVDIARGRRTLVSGLDLILEPGSITVLAGPNGAGKSTLLECLAGDLAPAGGAVRIGGERLCDLSLSRRAGIRTMLRQHSDIAFDFSVQAIVAMGLHPHGIGAETDRGRAQLARAISDLDLEALALRPATRLSGGEAQRVHLARCLVQLRTGMDAGEGGLLLLDEPTSGLDYRHQLTLLRLLKAEARRGATILASLHDLPLACRLADRLLLGEGRLQADVEPAALRAELVARLYGIAPDEALLLLGGAGDPLPIALAAE